MFDAVVLAGGLNNGALQEVSAVEYEALIPIGSKLMVDYVVEALIKAKTIDRIVVVGPSGKLTGHFNDLKVLVVEAGNSLMDTFSKGLSSLTRKDKVLVVTADIPLLTPQAIDEFIQLCSKENADLYYPIVPRETVECCYQKTHRTYVSFKEGIFTGGNMFLVNPSAVKGCMTRGQEIVNLRKKPLKLCRLVGFKFLLKYLLRVASLQEAQLKASSLLGIKGRAIIFDYPEVGVDVDKPCDLDLVNQTLGIV